MTRLKSVKPDSPEEAVDRRLRDVIALVDHALCVKAGRVDLAAVDAEQEEAAAARARARQAGWQDAVARQPMLAVAVHLARALAIGDRAGADVLLSRQRSLPEWRDLALILAAAADQERITVPEETGQAPADGARQALRRAS